MKLSYVMAAVAVIALTTSVIVGRGAQAQGPSPTSGTLLAGNLQGATGAAIGPGGALYVPQVGTGGDRKLTPPPDAGITGEVTFGLTAKVIRIDPDTGNVTTVAKNLPSVAFDGEGSGLADVAFVGGNLYVLLTSSPDAFGVTEWPNGVYRITNNGTAAKLVANIGKFNSDHPVAFPDAVPGGNPFSLEPRGSGFVVSDGNYNRLLSVQTSGEISILSTFDNIVPTGLASKSSGPVLNTWFSPEPHFVGTSKVVSVAVPGGGVTELASGPTQMIDVSFGPGGKTYVLQFAATVVGEAPPPDAPPTTGRIYLLENGKLTLLVDGFVLPTSLDFDGDTAFVTTLTGEVWKVNGVSSLAPLPEPSPAPTAQATTAPVATPTRGVGVTAPDTGNGGYLDGSRGGDNRGLLVLLAVAASGLGSMAVARRRYRRR